jgi:tRNA:m4X modification enzyme
MMEHFVLIRIEGILIALCCHHRCDWSSYVGKDFLLKRGLTGDDFSILQGITSWAVCGTGKPRDKQDTQDTSDGEFTRLCCTHDIYPFIITL